MAIASWITIFQLQYHKLPQGKTEAEFDKAFLWIYNVLRSNNKLNSSKTLPGLFGHSMLFFLNVLQDWRFAATVSMLLLSPTRLRPAIWKCKASSSVQSFNNYHMLKIWPYHPLYGGDMWLPPWNLQTHMSPKQSAVSPHMCHIPLKWGIKTQSRLLKNLCFLADVL